MLAGLTAGSVADAARRERDVSLDQLRELIEDAPEPRDALAALAPRNTVHVIAEIKRASPSRGQLATLDDPVEWAQRYEAGGASAISVLTEERKFLGSLDDLRAIRAAVNIPVLRKDFIATPYQVWESRAYGADMVLLIVAALETELLQSLYQTIVELRMTPLVEVHSVHELETAQNLGAQLIGVNARDLTTFNLDRDLFGRLVPHYRDGVLKVAESAVLSAADVARYRSAGADIVLVGEALVTGDPKSTLKSFLEAS